MKYIWILRKFEKFIRIFNILILFLYVVIEKKKTVESSLHHLV